MTASDEFSSGIRGRRKVVANRARPVIRGADVKPEAMTRVTTGDAKLDNEIHKIQRAIEQIQGTRGQQADHGVTFRDLEGELKAFTAEIENGFLEVAQTTDTANTAGDNANAALADAAVAQATADQALSDANEAHTGDVVSAAGSRVLTVHESAITNQPPVATESVDGAADEVLIHDANETTLKRAVVDELTDGGYF